MGLVERVLDEAHPVDMLLTIVVVGVVLMLLGVIEIIVVIYMGIQCTFTAFLIGQWLGWDNDEVQKENTGGT